MARAGRRVVPVTNVAPYKLNEVSRSISTDGQFGSFGITVAMDKSTYDERGDEQKKSIRQAGDDIVDHLSEQIAPQVASDIARLRDQGVEMYSLASAMRKSLESKYEATRLRWLERMSWMATRRSALSKAIATITREIG